MVKIRYRNSKEELSDLLLKITKNQLYSNENYLKKINKGRVLIVCILFLATILSTYYVIRGLIDGYISIYAILITITLIIVAMGYWFFFESYIIKKASKKIMKEIIIEETTNEITLSNDTINIKSIGSETTNELSVRLDEIDHFEIISNFFYLSFREKDFLYIPMNSFKTSEDRRTFENIVKKHIKS